MAGGTVGPPGGCQVRMNREPRAEDVRRGGEAGGPLPSADEGQERMYGVITPGLASGRTALPETVTSRGNLCAAQNSRKTAKNPTSADPASVRLIAFA